MRIPVNKDVDGGSLADQFTAALGRPVAVTTVNKGTPGNVTIGTVVLVDPATGNELPDQDATKVNNVLAAHVVPPPPVTPHKALMNALASAANLSDLKAALMTFAGSTVAQEDQQRQRHGGGNQG